MAEAPGRESAGILGVQLVADDGEINRSCARFPSPGRLLCRMLGLDRMSPRLFPACFMIEWDHGATRRVDQVPGGFLLVRRHLFEALGGFDERFFMYFEDVDICRRAKEAGFDTVYFAGARAYHRERGATDLAKAKRLFYLLRSRILYAYKTFGPLTATALFLTTVVVEPWPRLAAGIVGRSEHSVAETLRAYARLWAATPSLCRTALRARHGGSAS
jgi:hypothetical protein